MKYRIFLSDFDGTLVRADGTISETNKRAIAEYRAAGGIFAVCTGRMLTSILPRLKELGIRDGLVVAYQGATIADVKTGELLKDDGFDREDALRILDLLEDAGHHTHVYTVHDLYCNRDDDALRAYEHICGVKAGIVRGERLSAFVKRNGLRVVKILAMVETADRRPLMEMLQKALGEGFYVTTSSDFLVEIMPAGQSKAAAVDYLSEYYRVPRAEIAAIGDQLNDLPMVMRAGGSFAVANAEPELKKIARVVPSVEEDGVAEALKIAMGDEDER